MKGKGHIETGPHANYSCSTQHKDSSAVVGRYSLAIVLVICKHNVHKGKTDMFPIGYTCQDYMNNLPNI